MATLTPEVTSALRGAGSQALTGPARALLLRRIELYGVDPTRRNIGGTRDGGHGQGDQLATFQDYPTAAARLVHLCRIAAGEDPAELAGQTFDGCMGAFVSIAPERGDPPLEITHNSETGEALPTMDELAAAIGGTPDDAAKLVTFWRDDGPRRPEARAEIRARLAEAGATDPDQATQATCSLLSRLAGIDDDGTGAVRPRIVLPPSALRRPAPYQVLAAQQRAALARAAVAAQRAELAQLQATPTADDLWLASQAAAQLAQQQAADAAQTITPPTDAIAVLSERIAALEQEAAERDAEAAQLAGIFGQEPSAASRQAFQELAATHAAFARKPGIEKEPGYKLLRDDWVEFKKAWDAGDQNAPVCNGGSVPTDTSIFDAPACEAALNSRIDAAESFRKQLAEKDPEWAKGITVPHTLTLEQQHPNATAAENAAVKPALKIPGLDRLTDPATGLLSGKAPRWQYILAGVFGVTVVGAAGYGIAKAAG